MQNIFNLFKTNKRLAVIVILLIGGFVFFLTASMQESGFRVLKTNPKLGDVTIYTKFIEVEFNEPFVKDSLKIPDQDSVKSVTVTSEKKVTIFLKSAEKGKKQTITIEAATSSTTGAKISNKKLSFKAKDASWEKTPREQQLATLDAQDQKAATLRDPVMDYMPHNTFTYKLSAIVDGDKIKLHATLTPSFADTLDDNSVNPASIDRYKKQVLAYLKSINIDPAKYDLYYTVINPNDP
ncbi:MAG: hypothetical protein ABWX94_01160 [Candidatus Saccharimonadales bacterium]